MRTRLGAVRTAFARSRKFHEIALLSPLSLPEMAITEVVSASTQQLVRAAQSRSRLQHQVDDDDIRLKDFEQAQSGEPIRGGADLVAGHSQRFGKNLARAVVVLDQEYLG